MREIKFRAWDKELNCWMKNPMKELMINFYSNSGMPIFIFDQPGTDSLETRGRYIIQQYIGIKDKNGNEIYEGDVIRTLDLGNTLGEVCWRNEVCAFELKINEKFYTIDNITKFEIVGKIINTKN